MPNPAAAPKVPGTGRYPIPAPVAIHTAAPRRFSVTIRLSVALSFRGLFGRRGFGLFLARDRRRNPIAPRQPVVQVDQLAALAAKGHVRVSLAHDFFFADGAPHINYELRITQCFSLSVAQFVSKLTH